MYTYTAVVDHAPSEVYEYMFAHGLAGATPLETMHRVLDDLRSDFRHSNTADDFRNTAHSLHEALTTYVVEYDVERRVSRAGCHSMTRIIVGMLRSVNIPGVHTTDGTWFPIGHASATWPALERVLPHGDDIYNATLRDAPSDELLPAFAYYEENQAAEPCAGDLPCLSLRHRALLGIAYPSSYTLARCCDPAAYGYTSCEDFVTQSFGSYLTPDEIADAVATLESMCND